MMPSHMASVLKELRTRARTRSVRAVSVPRSVPMALRESLRVAGRHQRIGVGAEDLRYAADIAGDDRHAGGNAFKHDVGQRLGPGGNDQHAAERECLARIHRRQEADLAGEPEFVRERAQFVFFRAGADCGER